MHEIAINKSMGMRELNKAGTLETVINLYQGIEALPIEQVLSGIDFLTEEIPILLEKYEFNSPMSWGKWLKKHWKTAPIDLLKLMLKFLLRLKPGKLSSFMFPRPNVMPPLHHDIAGFDLAIPGIPPM